MSNNSKDFFSSFSKTIRKRSDNDENQLSPYHHEKLNQTGSKLLNDSERSFNAKDLERLEDDNIFLESPKKNKSKKKLKSK